MSGPRGSTDLRWTSPNAGTTAGARRTVLRPPRRPSWRFAARVTVAMLQAGMLFQFGFNCCLVRYLLAALLERDGFVLVLRSRESFCVSLLLPHTCCVCRVCVHPGHRAGRICTCSTLQWSKHILGRPGSAKERETEEERATWRAGSETAVYDGSLWQAKFMASCCSTLCRLFSGAASEVVE